MADRSGAERFAQYNLELAGHLAGVVSGDPLDVSFVQSSLDGGCAQRLRELVPRLYRREVGAFFTPSIHRAEVLAVLAKLPRGPYLDPTCGAGDLLLAASSLLKVGPHPEATIRLWGAKLFGWDIHPEFVQAARLRLLLAALSRSRSRAFKGLEGINSQALSGIETIDAIARLQEQRFERTVVLMNPPFGSCPAPRDCSWSGGQVSRAALFVESVMDRVDPDSHIVAILPDVLRTGSRYEHWRKMMESRSKISTIKPLGIFDEHTDVDVFLLSVRKVTVDRSPRRVKSRNTLWWEDFEGNGGTLGDHFSVMVGAVVDNRDPHVGEEYPFIIARDLPPRGEAGLPLRTRKFSGRVFTPPFVLLRRISRPVNANAVRAPGVLITGDRPIAIDNHLLVVSPRDGDVDACRQLLLALDAEGTTKFLDQRLRCRHLTVGAVREIPWSLTSLSLLAPGGAD